MEKKHHREDLLEAILMAEEHGENTIESILNSQSEDRQIEISREDIEALEKEGDIVRDESGLQLTESGRYLGMQTLRRHRLTEMLLFSMLGLERELASEIGCRVEHGIREEMLDGICTLLGHPQTCPHGRPIPPGECCRKNRTTVPSQVVPLSSLRPGESGRIVYITPRHHQRLHKLSSMGINPGVVVELHRKKPAFILHFEGTDLALEKSVADDIHVSRMSNGG